MRIVLALIATPFRIFLAHQEVCVTTAVSQLATVGVAVFFLTPLVFVSELENFSFCLAAVVLSFVPSLTYPFSNICLFGRKVRFSKKGPVNKFQLSKNQHLKKNENK